MKKKDYIGILIVVALMMYLFFIRCNQEKVIEFATLNEAKFELQKVGIFCTSDGPKNNMVGFLISEVPVETENVALLHLPGKKMNRMAWVSAIKTNSSSIATYDDNMRIWGNLCITGDMDFINEIEGRLR